MLSKVEKGVSVDKLARENLSEAECAQADQVRLSVEIVLTKENVRLVISGNKALLGKLLIGLGGLGAILSWISTL